MCIIKGDVTIRFHEDAHLYQSKIEKSLDLQLDFKLKPGDKIVAQFDDLPDPGIRRSKKIKQSILDAEESTTSRNERLNEPRSFCYSEDKIQVLFLLSTLNF